MDIWFFNFIRMVMNISALISFGVHSHINRFLKITNLTFVAFSSFKMFFLLFSVSDNPCIHVYL